MKKQTPMQQTFKSNGSVNNNIDLKIDCIYDSERHPTIYI